MFEDVTERQRHDAEMDFIVAEMRHRMKNMSVVVRSVITNTRADQPDAANFKEALLGRLDVTFKAQDIAARSETADFEFLIRESISIGVSKRLDCSGPTVEVPSAKVLPVSMIFHELSTNAMKYGAISEPQGRIHVSWELETGTRGRQLIACQWREKGGPPVSDPQRRGYGSELIEGLSVHIAGSVELSYPAEGFIALIKIPV